MTKTLAFSLTVGFGGLAAAQPTPPPGDGTGTTDITPTPPTPPPTPPPPPVMHAAPEAAAPVRPSEIAFAIGLGYLFPDNLETPNTTSVRLRLVSGLTFEPRVTVSNSSTDMDLPAGQTTDTTSKVGLSTVVRIPFITHGHVDFELLGSAGLSNTKHNPQGDYNTNTVSTLELGWGIGIGYWITHHWQLSFSAENPLITYTSTKQETGPTTSMTTKTTDVAVIFDPIVLVMIHLYN